MNIAKLKKHIIRQLGKRLSDQLTYHSVNHTLCVLHNCNIYIRRMKIAHEAAHLLRTAALMHDTGFMSQYEDHEEQSIRYVNEVLPAWDYTYEQIEIISGIIRATKIPQQPKNVLEDIIKNTLE